MLTSCFEMQPGPLHPLALALPSQKDSCSELEGLEGFFMEHFAGAEGPALGRP